MQLFPTRVPQTAPRSAEMELLIVFQKTWQCLGSQSSRLQTVSLIYPAGHTNIIISLSYRDVRKKCRKNCFNDFQKAENFHIAVSHCKNRNQGILLWCSALRNLCCHCSHWGGCSGAGSVPGLGTSTCHGHGQKNPKNKTKQKQTDKKST